MHSGKSQLNELVRLDLAIAVDAVQRRFPYQSLSPSSSSSEGLSAEDVTPCVHHEPENVRTKQQRKSTLHSKINSNKHPPQRSFSAEQQFKVGTSAEDVTLGIKQNVPSGGVKLEIRNNRKPSLAKTKSKSNMTLDELLESHHPPRRRQRHRLTARGSTDRFELRKSLSYGAMQDLAQTFHSTDILELKQSLHGVQRQRKEGPELAEQLAHMFEEALQRQDSESYLAPSVRNLILALTVEDMAQVVQHLDHCQTHNEPVQWTLLQSILDPQEAVDWTKVLPQPPRTAMVGSDEESYETWIYDESSVSSSGGSSSYIMSDNGEAGNGFDFDEYDESDMSFLSLDASTEYCDSSVTMEDLGDFDESFAFEVADEEEVVVEVGEDFDASEYELVEESFVIEEEDAEVYEETEVEEDATEEELLSEDESEVELSEVDESKVEEVTCSNGGTRRAEVKCDEQLEEERKNKDDEQATQLSSKPVEWATSQPEQKLSSKRGQTSTNPAERVLQPNEQHSVAVRTPRKVAALIAMFENRCQSN